MFSWLESASTESRAETSSSAKIFEVAMVAVISILNSLASASTSTYSGMSIFTPRFSFIPGRATPIIVVREPSFMSLAFLTEIFENFSFESIIPESTA